MTFRSTDDYEEIDLEESTVRFNVPGIPVPQGSKRYVGNGIMVDANKNLKPWRSDVQQSAIEAMACRNMMPYSGAVMIGMRFVLPRPKSAPKTKVASAAKKPDLDKLVRAIFDAVTGIVFDDDSQVIFMHAHKAVADSETTPGVEITVVPEDSGT